MGAERDVNAGQESDRPLTLDSYGRLSRVPETGELEKIDVQWADNRKVIKRVGAVLGEELRDGLSAWKKGVRRPGWERLLERVELGESDGVVVWHTDRLFRQPRDLERLIELGERGVKVYSAHGARDLADPDDRFILRIEVAHAARSSDDTSRRIKRRFATFREQGRVTGGPRRFGFPGKDVTWTPAEGQTKEDQPMVSAELVARERQALQDAAKAVLAGVSMAQVARDWNEAGLKNPAGRGWTSVSVRDSLSRPLLAGRITHEGVVVARYDGEPVLDDETFDRLQALFLGRRRGRVVGEKYVGTGIIRCGVCKRPLSARKQEKTYADGSRRSTYFCNPERRGCGKVYADVRAVDHELRKLSVKRLSDPRRVAAIGAARSQVAGRLAEVKKEIAEIEVLQRALSDRLGRREIRLDAFDVANKPLAADLARLLTERDSLPGGLPDTPPEELGRIEVESRWDDAVDVADRRAMLTDALENEWLLIDPKGRGGSKVFDPTRMRLSNPES